MQQLPNVRGRRLIRTSITIANKLDEEEELKSPKKRLASYRKLFKIKARLELKFTRYFTEIVAKKRPQLVPFVEYAIQNSELEELQDDGRMRYYAFISQINEYVRVVEEPNGEILNIMEDPDYLIRKNKGLL